MTESGVAATTGSAVGEPTTSGTAYRHVLNYYQLVVVVVIGVVGMLANGFVLYVLCALGKLKKQMIGEPFALARQCLTNSWFFV